MTWAGKQVSTRDAVKIGIAVREACEAATKGIFHRDLTEGCAEVGWPWQHPLTLWTVAIHANVFPVRHTPSDAVSFEGPVVFGGPSFALNYSELGLFWDDPDLVGLARKRAAAPGLPPPPGRRSGLRPYDGW